MDNRQIEGGEKRGGRRGGGERGGREHTTVITTGGRKGGEFQ